jgi:GH25 family lysozyme M1 (1,4-beta-N-acetylmuramidase)
MIEGIDYYAGNGSPHLSGLAFAFIKATEGAHFTDPAYDRERTRIRAAGLVFGAYHFGHPEEDVNAEVEHFVTVAKPATGDVLILDFEDEKGNFGKLSSRKLTKWKNAWLKKVKARCPHNRVGLYCNVDVWQHRLRDDNAGDFLFIAQYGGSGPSIKDPWTIWQYRADHVDHDKARFDSAAAMHAWARLEGQAGQPH